MATDFYSYKATQAQNKIFEINSNLYRQNFETKMNTRAKDMAITAQRVDAIQEAASDIYWNFENPKEEANKRTFAEIVNKIDPNISVEQAYKNYKPIIRQVVGDDMEVSGVFELFGRKIWQGIANIGYDASHLMWMVLNPNADEETKKEEIERIRNLQHNHKRNDIYNDQFEGFVDKTILSAADFLPSMMASSIPTWAGYVLSVITVNPTFAVAGNVLSSINAGLMEGGSAATEAMLAGADVDTQWKLLTCVGIANGLLEYAGNVGERKIGEALGDAVKLNKAVGSGNAIAQKSVRQIWGDAAKDYAINLFAEPATEMSQEFVSMFFANKAAKWEEMYRGRKWEDEFTYTPQEMADAVWETGLSTFRGQLLLGLVGGVGEVATSYISGDARMHINADKYTKSTPTSITVNSSAVLSKPGTVKQPTVTTTDKKGNKVTKETQFDPVKVYETKMGYVPINETEAAKADNIKNKSNGKYGAMNVEVVAPKNASKQASAQEARRVAAMVPSKIGDKKITVLVDEDGTIQVNKEDMSSVVSVLASRNYQKLEGVSSDENTYTLNIGGKNYTVSDNITSTAQPVTFESQLRDMETERREGKYSLNNAEGRSQFLAEIETEFKKQGLKDKDLTSALDNSREIISNWQESVGEFVEEIKKSFPDADTQTLSNDVSYGTVAMIAKFMPIVGKDMNWAKNSIVIDNKLEEGVDKNGKFGGYSYWTDGNGKRATNYSDIKNHDGEKFHIVLSKLMNPTTGIHEIGHMALSMNEQKFINDDYFKTAFYDSLKKDNEKESDERKWKIGDATHEAFAEKLETYIETGVADNKEQASLFNKIINAIKAFFDKMFNVLTPDQLEFYDRLFDDENRQNTEENEQMNTDSAENSQNEADLFENDEQTERFQRISRASVAQQTSDLLGDALSMEDAEFKEKYKIDDVSSLNVNAVRDILIERGREAVVRAGLKNDNVFSDRMVDFVSDIVVDEINQRMEKLGKEQVPIGWYSTDVDLAISVFSDMFPELKNSEEARTAFLLSWAITSQGEKLGNNTTLAVKAYSYFRKNGVFPTEKTDLIANKGEPMRNNFRKLNNYLLNYNASLEGLRELFIEFSTAGEIEKNTGYNVSGVHAGDKYSYASILGPKIGGGFATNLLGNYDFATIDLWMKRAYERLTGAKDGTGDAPSANGHAFMQKVMRSVVNKYNADKVYADEKMNMSDVQAVMWYNEKNLYDKIMSQKADILGKSYSEAAAEYVVNHDNTRYNGLSEREKSDEVQRLLESKRDDSRRRSGDSAEGRPGSSSSTVGQGSSENESAGLDKAENREGAGRPDASEEGRRFNEQLRNLRTSISRDRRETLSGRQRPVLGYTGFMEKLGRGQGGLPEYGEGLHYRRNDVKSPKSIAVKIGRKDFAFTSKRSYAPSDEYRQEVFNSSVGKRTVPSATIYELDGSNEKNVGEWKRLFNENKKTHGDNQYRLSEYSTADLKKLRLFVSDDGMFQFGITEDNAIVAGVSNKSVKGAMYAIMPAAIEAGGRHLDCFDLGLPDIYSRFGFRAVARVAFDINALPEKTKENWKLGSPDVVFMAFDPQLAEENINYKTTYEALSAPLMEYEDAEKKAITSAEEFANKYNSGEDESVRFQRVDSESDAQKQVDVIIEDIQAHPEIYKDADGNLLAPNGEPSKLDEYHYALVRTPNFKNWFGDWINDPENASKAVDENGEPKVFLHGSVEQFDAFNKKTIRANESDAPFNGFWFTDKELYANPAHTLRNNLMKVFLNVRNPASYQKRGLFRFDRELMHELWHDKTQNWNPESRSTQDEMRYRLQAEGYDGVWFDKRPELSSQEGEKIIRWTTARGKKMSLHLEDDGYYYLYEGWDEDSDEFVTGGWKTAAEYAKTDANTLVVFEPNQIKSIDNNGNFDVNDERFRYQRFYETNSIEKMLAAGKMVNYLGLSRYSNQSSWAKAEMLAAKIAATGRLEWMTTLLNNCIAEVKGTGDFLWEEITEEDWKKITALWKEKATAYDAEEVRFRKEQTEGNDIIKSQMEEFEGKDVEKVLKRVLAWNLHTDETSAMIRWLQQYTGREGSAGDKNILMLARKMDKRGVFNDRVQWEDGTFASLKYRYLDMVQQTAYGRTKLVKQDDGSYKKTSEDRNYRTSRVGEAYWEGARREIEENAHEIKAIEQITTVVPGEGTENINGSAIEDNDLSFTVQNINERDVKKARAELYKTQSALDSAREELARISAERRARDEMFEKLRQAAEELGIEPREYRNIIELVDAIKEQGIYLQKSDELLNEYNLNRAVELQQKIDADEEKLSELSERVKDLERDKSQLEIKERRLRKKIDNRVEKIAKLSKELKEETVTTKEQAKEIDNLRSEIDTLVKIYTNKLAGMRTEHDNVLKELAKAYQDLEYMQTTQGKDLDYMTEQLGKANDKNDKLTEKLKAIKEELGGAKNEIKKIQTLKNRIADLEKANQEYKIENSRKRWKKVLTAKTGDPTRDKALTIFANAFFKKDFTPAKLDAEIWGAISEDLEYKGKPVKSIAQFLIEHNFDDGLTLEKGFEDLSLKDYKEFARIVNATKDVSRNKKAETVEEHNRKVDFISKLASEDIGDFELSEEDEEKARQAFLNGEYETIEKARKAVIAEKIGNPGSIEYSKRKKGLFYNKKFNPNNNLAYNSFVSFYNLLYKISPEFRDLMFFGSEEQKIEGLNEIYDKWYEAQAKRTGYVDNVLKEQLGSEKAIRKFKNDVTKKVDVKSLDDNSAVTPWLAQQQAWQNFAEHDTPNDTVNKSFTLEEVMAIYEHAKQNEDIAHILDGNGVNAWQMAWIVQQFEEEDGVFHQYKAIADAYQHAYEMSWDAFQKVANDVFGIALTRYEYYSPANSESSLKDANLSLPFNFDSDGEPINPRNTAKLKKTSDMNEKTGGNNPIKLQYVTDFANIVSKQEWLINSAGFWKMWDDIMSSKGGGLKNQIDAKYGSNVAKTVVDSMKAISNPEFSDTAQGLNKILNWIRNNSALANLGFSLSSTLQQPAVFFLGASKFGVRNMFRALGAIKQHGGFKDFIDYVYSKSPQVKHSGDTNIMYAEQAIQNSKLLKSIGLAQDVARFGMQGIEFLDRINRCIMWEAGRMYYEQKGITGKQAEMRATQDTMNMNSSRQAKDNSIAYNSKNPLWKSLLMFTNQLNKQWNMLIGEDGIGAIKEHEYKQFIATVVGMAFASTWVLFAKGKLLHTPEDKKWYEDIMKDYFAEGISVVPVVGDKISDFINGYNYIESDIVESMANLVKQVMAEDTGNKKKKVGTATRDAAVEFMEFFGAPKVPVKNTFSALFENGKYVGDEFFTGGRWARTILPYSWFEAFKEMK